MKFSRSAPWFGIQPKLVVFVKFTLLVGSVLSLGWGDESPSPSLSPVAPSQDIGTEPSPLPSASTLPDIEAKTYNVKVVRHTKSNKTYLFDDVEGNTPKVGKILLVKRGETEPLMAFRVIKNYPSQKQFAAKNVKEYGDHKFIDPAETVIAVEKIADIIPPPLTAQDRLDLKELEDGPSPPPTPSPSASLSPELSPESLSPSPTPTPSSPGDESGFPKPTPSIEPEVQPSPSTLDGDLDSAPSQSVDAQAKDKPSERTGDDDEEGDERFGRSVEEVYPLDPYFQWLTGGFGFFRNLNAVGGSNYYAGAGMRYGLTLGRMLFIRSPRVQDSVVIEPGVFSYKIVNETDNHSVLPILGILRYNILFGETFGIFFYGGVVYNYLLSSSNPTGASALALASTLPAAGGGFIFKVGPNWETRIDLGLDVIGFGLMLRF